MKAEKVLIPIGIAEDPTWCRAISINNDMTVLDVSQKLTIGNLKNSVGERLMTLLLDGYILRVVSDKTNMFIEAVHEDYLLANYDAQQEGE